MLDERLVEDEQIILEMSIGEMDGGAPCIIIYPFETKEKAGNTAVALANFINHLASMEQEDENRSDAEAKTASD